MRKSNLKNLYRTIICLLGLQLLCSGSAAYAADEVKFLSIINVPMVRYGITWQNSQTKLLLKNIAYEKTVSVVFEREGERTVSAASYFGPASDGYEVWIAHANVGTEEGYTYHAEYEVAGAFYRGDDAGVPFPLRVGPVLHAGQALQQVNTGLEFSGTSATVTAALRSDLAKDKWVSLRYAFDTDFAQSSQDFQFIPTYYYGYGSVDFSGMNNAEIWQAKISDIPAEVSTIVYELIYEADGIRYLDDNFGHKYRMSRYQSQ